MASNLLQNGSFELGWKDDQNRQIPDHFSFWYAGPEIPNELDPAGHKFVPPEMNVLHRDKIPEQEWKDFIVDGVQTLKIYKAWGAWWGRLAQIVTLANGKHHFSIWLYPDLYVGGPPKVAATDPKSCLIRLGCGAQVSDWLYAYPYLRRYQLAWEFEAVAGERIVFVEFKLSHPVKNNGLFTDNWVLTKIEQRGAPRVQFQKVYNVLPQKATLEQAKEVFDTVFEKKQTIGWSYDDAGVGDLDDRTANLYGVDPAVHTEYEEWYKHYYPDVKVVFLALPDIEPKPKPPPTLGWLGIHQLQNQPEGMGDFQKIGPPVFKAVDRIDQLIAAYRMMPDALKPHLKLVFRKFRADEGGLRYRNDKPAVAIDWVTSPCRDLKNELGAAGIPTSQVIFLGPNEVWEHDIGRNQLTIDLDMEIVKAMAAFNKREGTEFSYGGSPMAVGNCLMPNEPGGEEQWKRIKPLAIAIRDTFKHGCLSYHAYGLMHKDHPEYLVEYAAYLQMRWLSYYEWLKANGVDLPWLLGEGGHVEGTITSPVTAKMAEFLAVLATKARWYNLYVPEKNMLVTLRKRPVLRVTEQVNKFTAAMWLNPGQGWLGVIPPARAVQELVDEFDEPIRVTNEKHGYKACVGITPFQFGNRTDWAKFNYEKLSVSIASALRTKYAKT